MKKKDFPIFQNSDIAYLDTAATAQRPRVVIERMADFMAKENAPIHRGVYPMAEKATETFELSRKRIAEFVGANDEREIIFVRNATEGINLVAYAWARNELVEGDEVLITRMEHHANFVPWQQLAKDIGVKLIICDITEDGEIDMADFKKKLTSKTKLVATLQVSNVLGTINPIAEIGSMLRGHPALFLVDAAQSMAHMKVDVFELGCDFLVFSGHKLYGPTSGGALWAKYEVLESMSPFMTGGHMIRTVSLEDVTWDDVPWKFEAGSPDSVGAVGLASAVEYVSSIGWEKIEAHERELIVFAAEQFAKLSAVTVYGPKDTERRSGVFSFTVNGVHAHDVASLLAEEGIAIRAGHHCAMPLHERLGVPATARISFGVYTEKEDLERFFSAMKTRVLPLANGG